jgi:hypothetical protein
MIAQQLKASHQSTKKLFQHLPILPNQQIVGKKELFFKQRL